MEQNTNDSVNCARVFITCKYCMRLFGVKDIFLLLLGYS